MLEGKHPRTAMSVFLLECIAGFFVCVVFFLILFSTDKKVADAQVVNFYSTECDGGWDNPGYAAGEPTVLVQSLDYTAQNSAYLHAKLSPLTCGGFLGKLPAETYYTRVMVRFSWKQETATSSSNLVPVLDSVIFNNDDSTNTESAVDSDASGEIVHPREDAQLMNPDAMGTSTSSVSVEESSKETDFVDMSTSSVDVATNTQQFVPEDLPTVEDSLPTTSEAEPEPVVPTTPHEAVPVSEPEPELVPAAELNSSPDIVSMSWWQTMMPRYAYAEELSSSTVVIPEEIDVTLFESATVTSEENSMATTSVDTPGEKYIATTTPDVQSTPAGAQFVVRYTVDGFLWHVLGYITTVDNDVRLEFPKEIFPTLDDISRMKISITPLEQIDTMPGVYLDGIWLEVSYAPLGELGVHGISDIVPTIAPFDSFISDTAATNSAAVATSGPHMSTSDFANRITAVHGINERYVLVNVSIDSSTEEVWLFDMADHLVHRIGWDKAQIGTMRAGVKDGMIFWLDVSRDTIYTYDLRTAGSLYEMTLVGNLPVGAEYSLTFPFTSWQVIWRGDSFYFSSRKTGEVFPDENTVSSRHFFDYFALSHHLPYDRIQSIGGTFVDAAENTFMSESSSTIESQI